MKIVLIIVLIFLPQIYHIFGEIVCVDTSNEIVSLYQYGSPWPGMARNQYHNALTPFIVGDIGGENKCSYSTLGELNSNPVIDNLSNTYIQDSLGWVYKINTTCGLVWKQITDQATRCGPLAAPQSPAIGTFGLIYVVTTIGTVYGISLESGEIMWSININNYLKDFFASINDSSYDDIFLRYPYYQGVSASPSIGSDGSVFVVSTISYCQNDKQDINDDDDDDIFNFKSSSSQMDSNSTSFIPVIAPSRRDSGTVRNHRTRSSLGSKGDILSFDEDLFLTSNSNQKKDTNDDSSNNLVNAMGGMKIKLKPPPSGTAGKTESRSRKGSGVTSIPMLPPPRESPKSPLKTNNTNQNKDTFDFFGNNSNDSTTTTTRPSKTEENSLFFSGNTTQPQVKTFSEDAPISSTSPFDASNSAVIPISNHENTMLESMKTSQTDPTRSSVTSGENQLLFSTPSLPPPPSSSTTFSNNQKMVNDPFASFGGGPQGSQNFSGSDGFPSSSFPSAPLSNNPFPTPTNNTIQTNRPSFDAFNAFSSSNNNSQQPTRNDPFNTNITTPFSNVNNAPPFPGSFPNNTSGQTNQVDPFSSSGLWQPSPQPSQQQGNSNVTSNSNSTKESSNPFDLF